MTPILPREMLWTEKLTMEEFFKLDSINEEFFEVFLTLREEPFAVKANEVKVFNEVYYQVTRMLFEYPMPNDLEKYVSDIKANMGWNYSAELVMSMAYFQISLIVRNTRQLNKFFTKAINERFFGCMYWKPFKHCFEKLKKEHRNMTYQFKPCPRESEWFKGKYVQWKKITHEYDLSAIVTVINLWDKHDDKSFIAQMIQNSIIFSNHFIGKNVNTVKPILDTLTIYQVPEEYGYCVSEDMSSYGEDNEDDIKFEEMRKEREALLSRISELEADNERLNTLLDKKKKKTGTARKFTLVEIVDYCKSRVEWDDAKSIVAMLNKLLRRIGTEEDSDLVDSIEEEFINRRYGNTYVENQTIIPNVGNYQPQIGNQHLSVPVNPLGKQGQNLLKDE